MVREKNERKEKGGQGRRRGGGDGREGKRGGNSKPKLQLELGQSESHPTVL